MLVVLTAMENVLSAKLNKVRAQIPLLQIPVLQEPDPQIISRLQIAHQQVISLKKTTHLQTTSHLQM